MNADIPIVEGGPNVFADLGLLARPLPLAVSVPTNARLCSTQGATVAAVLDPAAATKT